MFSRIKKNPGVSGDPRSPPSVNSSFALSLSQNSFSSCIPLQAKLPWDLFLRKFKMPWKGQLLRFQNAYEVADKKSTTRRELLVFIIFTTHFRHFLLGQKFMIASDHRALQWLHNFKYPEGLTGRWLEKNSFFQLRVGRFQNDKELRE